MKRNFSRNKPTKAGYSLVEVMVAMTVIAMFSSGVFGVIFMSSAIYQSSREAEIAGRILQYEIENVRGMNWSSVSALPITDQYDEPTEMGLSAQFLEAYEEDYNYTVTREVTSPTTDMRTITFKVKWTDRQGNEKELGSPSIYYAKNGISDGYYRAYN